MVVINHFVRKLPLSTMVPHSDQDTYVYLVHHVQSETDMIYFCVKKQNLFEFAIGFCPDTIPQ